MDNTIVEGNAIIAKFDGHILGKDGCWTHPTGYWENFKTEHFLYHESWDMLMPVVEKIEKGARVDIYGKACKISQPQWDIDIAHINESKLTAVWICVVEFITWYNQQQSSKKLITLNK